MILTNDKGIPYKKPVREDYATHEDFVAAFYSYKDAIAHDALAAFDKQLQKSLVELRCFSCGMSWRACKKVTCCCTGCAH